MPRPLGFSEQYTMAGAVGFVQASVETFARTPSSEKSEVLIEGSTTTSFFLHRRAPDVRGIQAPGLRCHAL
jgi:hypothetical protein